jgi:hypothetical protein
LYPSDLGLLIIGLCSNTSNVKEVKTEKRRRGNRERGREREEGKGERKLRLNET